MLAHLRRLMIRRRLQLSLKPNPECRSRARAQMKGERRERHDRNMAAIQAEIGR